jgi:hypothetical protein
MLQTERFRKRDHFAPSGETVASQYAATFDRKGYPAVLDSVTACLKTFTGLQACDLILSLSDKKSHDAYKLENKLHLD